MPISRNKNKHANHNTQAIRRFGALLAVRYSSFIIMLALAITLFSCPAHAKGGDACTGGGFSITKAGVALSGAITTTIAASDLSAPFHVQGKYVEFDVNPGNFAVLNYTLTGAANPLDITGGLRTVIFASKTPDLRGATLAGNASVQLGAGNLVLQRSGPGVSMTIQVNDCTQGGIFQMEPERADGTATTITHVLAHGVFYFDNPNFRNPPPLPLCTNGNFNSGCYPVKVTPRINFANDASPSFVGRDSPQVATRLAQFGNVSVWSVGSGGRMGGVLGGDAVEVAPPAAPCTQQCTAQDRGRGRFPILGFPFPVPQSSRLAPQP
jgi:hypothetical protein